MYLAKVVFDNRGAITRSRLQDLADSYLDELGSMGQCGEHCFVNWVEGKLTAHLEISRPDAMALEHHSEHGRKHLEGLHAMGVNPVWTVLADSIPKRFPDWKRAPFLVLYASFNDEFPIRRGSDGCPFPAYLFPLEDWVKNNVLWWRQGYRDHMGVWFRSGKLEVPAYRQMADPSSELTQEGMTLCKEIEKATAIPTYYYLDRYWGRPGAEEKRRRCPSCGKKWSLSKPYVSNSRSWTISFMCEHCRLVSNLGDCFDNEPLAAIGEYKPKAK